MLDWIQNWTFVDWIFWFGLILTIVSFPFRDFISVGFYDISDFFISLVATSTLVYIFFDGTIGSIGYWIIFILVSAFVISLKTFVVFPFMNRADNSTVSTIYDLEGKVGKTMSTIKPDKLGEVMVFSGFSKITRGARIWKSDETSQAISSGTEVLIVEVKEGVFYVIPYKPFLTVEEQKATWQGSKSSKM